MTDDMICRCIDNIVLVNFSLHIHVIIYKIIKIRGLICLSKLLRYQ